MSFIVFTRVTLSAAVLILCAAGATAAAQGAQSGGSYLQKGQTTMNGQVMQNGPPSGSSAMSIRQGLQNSLQQAGYTDVIATPSSFYVRAKDKQGHPVAMVIGPDTVTAVTELPTPNGTAAAGSESQSGGAAPAGGGGAGSAP